MRSGTKYAQHITGDSATTVHGGYQMPTHTMMSTNHVPYVAGGSTPAALLAATFAMANTGRTRPPQPWSRGPLDRAIATMPTIRFTASKAAEVT